MNARVTKKVTATKTEEDTVAKEDSDEEFYDAERTESDSTPELPLADDASAAIPAADGNTVPTESSVSWKEELAFLVQGGVPMALRGEVRYNLNWCGKFFLSGLRYNSLLVIAAMASFCGCQGSSY